MPRVTLTAMTALGPYNPDAYAVANAADLPMTAADITDFNDVVMTDRQLLLVHNTGGSGALFSVISSNDPYGRKGNIVTYSIGAGDYVIFGPFKILGWTTTSGRLNFNATSADFKVGIINLPL